MKRKYFSMAISIIASSFILGCGGGSSDEYKDNTSSNTSLYKLQPQSGTQSYLFYGDVNFKSLGSLNNVRVFDPKNPRSVLVENNDTSDYRYSVINTKLSYNKKDQSYSDLHLDSLSYISNNTAYMVSMIKSDKQPVAKTYSKLGHISDADFEKIDYLGSRWYLTAHDDDANKTVMITPDMSIDDSPLNFENKTLLSVTFPDYGDSIDGYLVYDNSEKAVQKCSLDMSSCDHIDVNISSSRNFEGDLQGTTYSAFVIEDEAKLFRVNKADKSVKQIDLGNVKILDGHGTTDLFGESFYFIGEDHNLYRANMLDEKITKITQNPDERIERIRGYTDDYVIFGSDTLLMAAKKDGSSPKPILLAETTKTAGYKYVKDYGIGNQYLYVTYNIDTKTNDTYYKACIFDNANIECKDNSFWAGATVKKDGKRDFKSNFTYTPYAYIRVDDTDNFGGGTLKAIDPAHPFDDGISMGKIDSYNFQTFLTNSRYKDETIDSDGGVVFYAKNDQTFHIDAFYFNLLQENSLVQLTDTDPFPDVINGRDHCHGRVCMICHNLAGGKIYKDTKGSRSAYGYRVKIELEDKTTFLADIAKGKGENFSFPIKKLTKNFKAYVVVDENGTVVNSSAGYYHEGVEAANCNFCHGRYGNTRYEAPGAISITR